MTDQSAEYRFYARPPKLDDERAPCEPVDLNEWGRLLDTDTQFAAGGRYGIIPEHFEGREFPIEDCFFDVVVAMMVMEHVFDPFHFCRELHRILRPSGALFINIPLVTAIGHRLTLLTGRLPVTSQNDCFDKRAWDGAHLHYFTLPLLRRLLGVYGFEIDLLRGVGRLHKWKTRFPTLLAKEISVRARKVT